MLNRKFLLTFISLAITLNIFAQSDAEKQGKEIYEKYQKTVGSKENDQIKTVETIKETESFGVKKVSKTIEDRTNKPIIKSYSISEGGIEGKQENGFDGKRYWAKNNTFRGFRDSNVAFVDSGEVSKRIKVPNELIDGKEYLVVEEIYEGSFPKTKTYYDPNTFLLFQIKSSGNGVEQTTTFSDYRKVGKVLVPFSQAINSTQGLSINTKIISVKHNIKVDPTIFEFNGKTEKVEKTSRIEEKKESESVKIDLRNGSEQRASNAIVSEKIKKETLEKAWNTINDTYYDTTFNGVNWKEVKTKYERLLTEVKTNQDLTDLLNRMVGELKVSHLKVIPPDRLRIMGNIPNDLSKIGTVTIDLRMTDNSEIVVTNVNEKSTAERAGIRKGYVIKKVDGKTIEEIVDEHKKRGGFNLRDEIVAVRAVTTKLGGNVDKKVSLTVIDESDKEKTVEVERQSMGLGGNLSGGITFESKELNDDVGYIRFNRFMGDLPNKFESAIKKFKDKKAVIIDLRGNPGGIGNHTTAIAAMLDKEKRSLGSSQYRYNKQEFAFEGNDKSYKGKVLILIDELSGSSSEVFAGGMQANSRATIIGQNSAGAVLPSTTQLLPYGGVLQFAVGDFKTPNGKTLEGKGVVPDVEVKLTRRDLLAGKDLAIETALKLVS
jgi:carboxyl-terminal processing protease